MLKRRLTYILVLLIVFSFLLPGCTSKTATVESSPSAQPTASAQAQPTAKPTQAPPDKITIFYSSGGQALPDKFNYKDNEYFQEICKLANVEPVEVTVPAYADTKTKFNLMMASGTIPDVIHYSNFAEMSQYGIDGAFLELSDIIKKSAILSKNYTQPMIEAMKANDGKVYTLRSLPTEDGWHLTARLDLLSEVGYSSKIPATLDEWVDALKKLKVKYPDSIPYTTVGVENYHHFIFKPYGCETGWGWQYTGGKVINTFENPGLKDAVNFGKMLLAEGLLDKEFATNKAQDYLNKKWTKNVLISTMNLGSLGSTIETYGKNNVNSAVVVPVKWPFINEGSLDPYQKYVSKNVVNNQCISISSKTKQQAAAIRFIETLYTDKVKDLFIFGREGVEYTVKDGKKVIDNAKSADTNWRNLYGMMFSYNPLERTKLRCDSAIDLLSLNDTQKNSYKDVFTKYFNDIYSNDYNKISYAPVTSSTSLIALSTEQANLQKEAIAQQKSLLLKALMSEISIDDFMKQAGELVKKYQSVTNEFNQKLPEIKTKFAIK